MRTRNVIAILVMLVTLGMAKDWPAMRDEADKELPPWIQYYNRLKGEPKLGPFDQHLSEPESLNVRLVGKWGRGPAARVTGRDTLVYLALGSEVAIFNCVNAHNPTIVNEIQCRYVVDRAILKDSILYCVLQGGVEVFNVANPASVTRIKYLPISTVDMCIDDTMAYTIDADSFKAYRIVAPDSFQRLGACADSGYYIAADSGFAYLCDRWGLYVIDATDPMNPHQATVLTGADVRAVLVDSGYCYYTTGQPSPNSFRIADVSDPYHPAEVGYINGIASNDLFKLSYFVYLPQYHIVDVSNRNSPTIVGSLDYSTNSVWTRSPFSYSFMAADYNGFAVVNITDPVHPTLDTVLAGADYTYDACAENGIACVANWRAGMKVLGVDNPAVPIQLGSYDTAGQDPWARAVRSRDTLAHLLTQWWGPTGFRVINVGRPDSPTMIGYCETWNPGSALALQDTLAYVVEDYHFEVFSVANPRSPRLVGSCGLVNGGGGISLQDSFAYVASDLNVVNIANPASPRVVTRIPSNCYSIAVQDTFAYVSHAYESLLVFSIADPLNPYEVGWARLNGQGYDVVVSGTRAYVGCYDFRVFDISDPSNPVEVGRFATPGRVRRVCYKDGLVYAACLGAGVCILETTSTNSVAEAGHAPQSPQAFELTPNPASSFVNIREEVTQGEGTRVRFYDTGGREVMDVPFPSVQGRHPRSQQIDISALPDGCYFVKVEPSEQDGVLKLVKFERRE